MNSRVRSLAPMLFVASVRRSIDFYEKFGFVLGNTFTAPGTTELNWAWLQFSSAQLMLAKATEPISAAQQAVMFYLYCDDVDAMKKSLTDGGISTGPIKFPFYAPKGEFRLSDPDGYTLVITHT